MNYKVSIRKWKTWQNFVNIARRKLDHIYRIYDKFRRLTSDYLIFNFSYRFSWVKCCCTFEIFVCTNEYRYVQHNWKSVSTPMLVKKCFESRFCDYIEFELLILFSFSRYFIVAMNILLRHSHFHIYLFVCLHFLLIKSFEFILYLFG